MNRHRFLLEDSRQKVIVLKGNRTDYIRIQICTTSALEPTKWRNPCRGDLVNQLPITLISLSWTGMSNRGTWIVAWTYELIRTCTCKMRLRNITQERVQCWSHTNYSKTKANKISATQAEPANQQLNSNKRRERYNRLHRSSSRSQGQGSSSNRRLKLTIQRLTNQKKSMRKIRQWGFWVCLR